MSEPQQAAPPPPLHGAALALMTAAVALGTFMEVLDTTIVNVSVPHIAGDLAASTTQGTWTISSYGLAAAIAVPLTGWAAKRVGQVKLFVISVLLFTLASVLCGFAHTLPELVAFRFMQGLVSGPMVPLSQTLLLANYPNAKKGLALALWSMTVVVAPICGPLLGGWITDNYSWPWIFYINVPVGLFAAAVSWRLLKHRETATAKEPIDVVGMVLLVVGVGALQVMLDTGNEHDWFNSGFIITLAMLAAVALTFLVAWELTDDHPIVDLSLFKSRNFLWGVVSLSLGMFCFFGSTVIFPLWLQTVKGYTATWAGVATAPVGVLAFFMSPLIGRNIHRINLRMLTSFAFMMFGITMFWYASFTLDTDLQHLMVARLVQGIGIACFFIPLNQIILSGIGPERMAAASGLSNFFRTLSGSFATAIVTYIWTKREIFHHARLTENINSASQATTSYLGQLDQLGIRGTAAYAQIDQTITQQAFQTATSEVFWMMGVIFIAMIAVVWLTRPPFGTSGGAGGH
ncbi:DHA2 family efflux MFS transporter permease subunit [Jeongeupia naejangsanensis]|uniref:DHA2 family efflux MFS transporter permease subunit n=1 Tax=Jeongeupia naejangsanensis TaxID=613195 RepID=A0ABS2BL84_9NEIS|nr:DHA2 family efflux MFS transporter permease subunit [Jeongeupia naejangsanensis]MBM3115746.1 DHA2 family efflux MFS transporter permease subunit [Jeongeupia naejangsanensis]